MDSIQLEGHALSVSPGEEPEQARVVRLATRSVRDGRVAIFTLYTDGSLDLEIEGDYGEDESAFNLWDVATLEQVVRYLKAE